MAERFREGPVEHLGEKYLKLLDLYHMADREISTQHGTVHVRDFLSICGEHALPFLEALAQMDPKHPKFEPAKQALRSTILKYIEGPSQK